MRIRPCFAAAFFPTMLKHLFAISLLTLAGTALACCNSELKEPSTAVRVIDPALSVSKSNGGAMVVEIGTSQNTTDNTGQFGGGSQTD